jgi:hypothetical protein
MGRVQIKATEGVDRKQEAEKGGQNNNNNYMFTLKE